jgi:hypothetical protein
MEEAAGSGPPGGVLWAAWRQGLKDLQEVVLTPVPDSMNTVSEPGSITNPTSQEVTMERQGGQEMELGE